MTNGVEMAKFRRTTRGTLSGLPKDYRLNRSPKFREVIRILRLELNLILSSRMAAICRDSEGWDTVSRLREFDITPCFEEGVIISGLLSVVFILTLLKTVTICFKKPLERSHKSIQILFIKLVCPSFLPILLIFIDVFNRCCWALP